MKEILTVTVTRGVKEPTKTTAEELEELRLLLMEHVFPGCDVKLEYRSEP